MTVKGNERQHHHRSSLRQNNKPFKGTTAAKRAENRGKLFKNDARSKGKPLRVESKADRVNRKAVRMEQRRMEVVQEGRVWTGRDGLAKMAFMVSISYSADVDELRQYVSPEGHDVVFVEKQKRRVQLLPKDASLIDGLGAADTVVLLADCKDDNDGCEDAVSLIRALGASSLMAVITGHNKDKVMAWKEYLKGELPSLETVFHLPDFSDQSKRDLFLFQLLNVPMKGLSWRNRRPYMIIEEATLSDDGDMMKLIGQVRNHSVSSNLRVHIPGFSQDRLIESIELLVPGRGKNTMDAETGLVMTRTEAMDREADVCDDMSDGLEDAQENDDDGDDNDNDNDDIDLDNSDGNDARIDDTISDCSMNTTHVELAADVDESCSEADNEELLEKYEASIMSPNPVKFAMDIDEMDLTEYQKLARSRQFSDELELDENISARERLGKYQAVSSLRTSEWNAREGLPAEYNDIFAFQNYRLSRKRAMEAINKLESPFVIGSRIAVSLNSAEVSTIDDSRSALKDLIGKPLFFLLNHEHRLTIVNCLVKQASDLPIASKDSFLMVAGHRRLWVRPIFSEHNPDTRLHRMLRQLPEDEPAKMVVASFYAPVLYDPCPIALFSEDGQLALHGSVLSNDPFRINLKRITLTGYPFRVHRRSVVVRFMFFNAADVNYFRPVELRTRAGRRGHIKESLGTHGYMKCVFDRQLAGNDVVYMHLYKRVFPRVCEQSGTPDELL